MPLTSLARVKGALRIPAAVTVHDARITEIVSEVDDELLELVDLTAFGATAYTATLDGEKLGQLGRTVIVPRMPLLSVAAITVDGTGLADGTGYTWERGGIIQLVNPAAPVQANILVTYTAGIFPAGATSNAMIRCATLMAVRQYNQEPIAGISELDVQPIRKEMARTSDEDAIHNEIQRILSRYRKPVF